MALENIPLLAQATVYSITLLLSITAILPMAWHVSNFNGRCLLYTHGKFDNTDGHLIPVWGSTFYCGLSLAVNLTALIVSVSRLVRTSRFLYRGTDSSFLSAFVDAVVSVGVTLTLFLSSVLVSDGFRSWCSTIQQRFPGCEEASVMELDAEDGIVTVGFYVMMGTAQFAHWVGWVGWVLQSVLCIRKMCIYHERENIIISMARERRLLNASQKAYTEIMQSAPYDSEMLSKDSDTTPILE
ncbi:transmembrane protein-like [Tropilaelaps mercedesae]|uniref:Transmembrane protein-like n=1 Tax=Tropilaelaps mercedesae TaxID=418985 RepID=A0A1V9Y233_9ACAR|nr:transmembrane protein-like [Tropilaelaps mercedesae]